MMTACAQSREGHALCDAIDLHRRDVVLVLPGLLTRGTESGKKDGLHTVRHNLARPAHLGTLSLKSMTQVFPA